MKKPFTLFTLAAFCTFSSCTKDASMSPAAHSTASVATGVRPHGGSASRPSGSGYSASIPVEQANDMIESYLGSVGYPTVDSTIRSLCFDADTLRSYLANHDITTIKFVLAHQPGYMNSDNYGGRPNLNPDVLTLVVVGLDDEDNYVLNNRNEVYDHMIPCPHQCPNTSATID